MKRTRGGQPGNQNARKHGLYCGTMTPDELCQFWDILNTQDMDPAVAVLRLKLNSALKADPGNRRLIRDAARLLAKVYGATLQFNKTDTNYFRKVILRTIEIQIDSETVLTDLSHSSSLVEAEIKGFLQNESRVP